MIIGENCKVEAGALLFNGVVLEGNVFIGPGVITTNDPKLKGGEFTPVKTLFKKGCKIGAGAIIIAGHTVGENSIVGAGSVVKCDIPPNEVWTGNPATFYRMNE